MYNLFMFDLDGTLTDSAPSIIGSMVYTAGLYGIEVSDPNELRKYIGPPLRDTFKDILGLPEDKMSEVVSAYRKYYAETAIFKTTVYPGIINLLKQLKNDGATIAIATSKAKIYAESIAEFLKIRQYFDFVSGCELNGTRELKSELIEYVFENIDPARKLKAVMIGDRSQDIIGANETGINSAGVLWGYGSKQELEDAGATYIAETTDELYKKLKGA